jgi:hypothetical protein
MDRLTEVHLDRSKEFRLGCSMDRSMEVGSGNDDD